jgi:hypothetical protein
MEKQASHIVHFFTAVHVLRSMLHVPRAVCLVPVCSVHKNMHSMRLVWRFVNTMCWAP